MKEIIKKIALISLTCFSFYYTDKVINLLNNKTPLMKEISSIKEDYKIEPVNSIIKEDTIIPGINGKEINIEKSYENMKSGGIFREELLIYKTLYPKEILSNNKNKYIIKGNNKENKVSLLIILKDNNIDKINNNITIFLNHKDININNIMKLKNNEIYTYGNNGIYNEDILLSDNTIINRISNNKSNYCLVKEKNNDILEICSKKNMYVLLPNVIGDYLDIKNNLSSGSIILTEDINNLNEIIKLINSKGYQIVRLSNLLEE